MQSAMILDEPRARMMAREDPRVLLWILKEHTRPAHELFLAAEFAGQTQHPDAIPILIDLLAADDSPLVREGAALGLTGTTDPRAIAVLERAAKFDKSSSVRLAAKDALDRD